MGGGVKYPYRSSLIWASCSIIDAVKPKVVIFENVKNLFYRHKTTLNGFKETLNSIGYEVSDDVILNAKNFGIPQNRERLFLVALLKSIFEKEVREKIFKAHTSLKIKKTSQNPKSLKDFLHIKEDFSDRKKTNDEIEYKKWTNFCTWKDKNGNINGSYNRAWKIEKYCGALNASNPIKITDGKKVGILKIEEYALLMGFKDGDCRKIKNVLNSKNKIRSLFGNSIVVPVAKAVIRPVLEVLKK